MAVTQEVKPPADGKQYRQLVRGIKLSVFGDSLPDKVLAIGGDGESQVAAEVGANANLDKEGKPLARRRPQGGGQASGRHDGGEAAGRRRQAEAARRRKSSGYGIGGGPGQP